MRTSTIAAITSVVLVVALLLLGVIWLSAGNGPTANSVSAPMIMSSSQGQGQQQPQAPPPRYQPPPPIIYSKPTHIKETFAGTVTKKCGLCIGGGIGCQHTLYELSHAGMCNSINKGSSGNVGVMLIEKSPDVCGQVRDIIYPESTGLNQGPYLWPSGAPNPNYKPRAMPAHAGRVNIATMPEMRLLAHDLGMKLYYSPWVSDTVVNGYRGRNGRYACNRSYAGENGFVTGCVYAGCLNRTGSYGPTNPSKWGCDVGGYSGTQTLVAQAAGNARNFYTNMDVYYPITDSYDGNETRTMPVKPAFNITTYNVDACNQYMSATPSETLGGLGFCWSTDYNGNPMADFDDEAWGYMLGFPGYVNPTYNYKGDGTTYNGWAPVYDAKKKNQKHPRNPAFSKQFTVTGLYENLFGPAGAAELQAGDFGFGTGDNLAGNEARQYLEWNYISYNELDEGYPVGGMSQFCIRQEARVKNNFFGKNVPATYTRNEAVVSMDYTVGGDTVNGKYVFMTDKGNKIYSDYVWLGVSTEEVGKMTGTLRDVIMAKQPFVRYANPQGSLTVTVKWNATTPRGKWLVDVVRDMWGSYRRMEAASESNRVEIFNDPLHTNGDLFAMRIGYQVLGMSNNFLGYMRADNPTDAYINRTVGYPKGGYVWNAALRLVKNLFRPEMDGPVTINPEDIPEFDHVYADYEDDSWFFARLGTDLSWQDVWKWAQRPLGSVDPAVGFVHGSGYLPRSGWMLSAVNMTRSTLSTMFPSLIPLTRYVDSFAPNGNQLTWGINLHGETNITQAFQAGWTVNSDWSTDLDSQYLYSNALPNEHMPPYTLTEPIDW